MTKQRGKPRSLKKFTFRVNFTQKVYFPSKLYSKSLLRNKSSHLETHRDPQIFSSADKYFFENKNVFFIKMENNKIFLF